jgi:hypothetical protein
MTDKITAELLGQLDQAGDQLVEAVVQLRPRGRSSAAISGEETALLAKRVLDRVAQIVGQSPKRSNLLRNLGTLIVEAPPEYVRSLIAQPEVIKASANRTAESPVIPPRGKRPVA